MLPRISIIIPCYNQGSWLLETLESLNLCDRQLFEVIVVNDGSSDQTTVKILTELKNQGLNVIFQENAGLSAARNAGINISKGDFILPLDSDNKIRPAYLTRALEIFDKCPEVDVVYGNALYFGAREGEWKPGSFNLQKIMISNYIDACALVRKEKLKTIGLYDIAMRDGWEDWDLWLRIAFSDGRFFYIDEILWDYRVTQNSMSKTLYRSYEKPNKIENYVNAKYPDKMGQQYLVQNMIKRFKSSPLLFIGKLVIRAYFPKYYDKLLQKNKIRNGI